MNSMTLPIHAATRASAITGTGTLLRFALLRDRLRIALWLLALVLSTAAIAAAFPGLYPDDAARAVAAQTMATPAGLAFSGPAEYLSDYSYGSMVGHQLLGFVAVLVGLMSSQFVIRHTRAEEEPGRAELVRAGVVGRFAPLTAALLEALLINLLLALLLWVGLGALNIESISWQGSFVYGLAHAAVGITFAGVAAVTAQIFQSSRASAGSALAVVGLAYLLRASGDAADSATSWASPIGWAQHAFPYLHDDLLPLTLNLAAGIVLAGIGFWLSTKRDLGAGLRAPRGGAPVASAALHTPLGFAFRLHRGSLVAYAVALAAVGAMYGPFFGDVEEMLQDIAILQDAVASIGGSTLVDSFITMIMNVLATIAAVFTVATVLRVRAEETAGRAELALSGWQSRTEWFASHLTVAVLGAPVILLLGGVALGATGAQTVTEADLFGKVIAAAAAYIPALWLLAGITAALVGFSPRLGSLAWLLVAYAGFIGYFGPILQLAEWTNWLSPFGATARLPVEDFAWPPALLVTAAAAVLLGLALLGFKRRDLATK